MSAQLINDEFLTKKYKIGKRAKKLNEDSKVT